MPPRLSEILSSIGTEANAATFEQFLHELGGSLERLADLTRNADRSVDVTDFDANELKGAFRDSIEDVGQEVIIAWPADHVAARTAYRDALERIDDLWYPSMDDLVVIDTREEMGRIIILDHEERLFSASLAT
ncbi:hypothetical protein [Streptomyces sp. NBC_00557]|uniref:hypothetical protein n=1 Tax=Streptomyces sp. NBC_00557 TaxID=2975776 RepID=UPI002E7FC36B|nr:hypothetical protein [Streptomyces sp. NBC_00557]WUC36212.1 hypothetical protein OG956_19340 [Streptomyces sp. NBC_00557]